MGKTYDEITDREMQKAFLRVQAEFNGHDAMRTIFFKIRDDINGLVRMCSKNVEVVIYVDDVLDTPVVVKSGKAENRLRITIRQGGEISMEWTHETTEKQLKDALKEIKTFILAEIGPTVRSGISNVIKDVIMPLLDIPTNFLLRIRSISPGSQNSEDSTDN